MLSNLTTTIYKTTTTSLQNSRGSPRQHLARHHNLLHRHRLRQLRPDPIYHMPRKGEGRPRFVVNFDQPDYLELSYQ